MKFIIHSVKAYVKLGCPKLIDMNDVIRTISERRAVRKYKSLPVSDAAINELLNAARMAPSSLNGQPWKFYVVTDRELIDLLDQKVKAAAIALFKGNTMKEYFPEDHVIFHGAPAVIFIAADRKNEWAALDIGMCAQNMMLAAKSIGLDTCPVGLGKFVEHTNVYTILGIPDQEQIVITIVAGYGDIKPPKHVRKTDNAVFVKYEHVQGLLGY